jgi:RNA polymerase sigma-70 factor (ECF subfamily)
VAVNGDAGVLVIIAGAVDLVIAFEVDDGRVAAIRMIRNPDKLSHVGHPVDLR